MNIAVGDELFWHVDHNSSGMRENREINPPKKKRRMLFLGDSFTWGFGVAENERFTELIENRLNQKDWEVLNMGVSGYSTDQEYLLFEQQGIQFDPDLVVLCFLSTNDIVGNYSTAMYGKNKPLYQLKSDGSRIELSNTPLAFYSVYEKSTKGSVFSEFHWFIKMNSFAYKFLRRKKNDMMMRLSGNNLMIKKTADQFFVFDERLPDKFADGWLITEKLLQKFQERCKEIGAEFVVFVFPRKNQLDPTLWKQTLEAYRLDPSYYKVDLPDSMLLSICEKNGLQCFSLLDAFQYAHKQGEELYFRTDGHWNAKGHELAAEEIYNKLDDIIQRVDTTTH